MLRLIKIAFLAVLMVVITLLCVANRSDVTINVMPEQLSSIYAYSFQLPLFAVILLSILTGLVIGYILEWLREHKHRKTAAVKQREVKTLEREVDSLKKKDRSEKDEILALLN